MIKRNTRRLAVLLVAWAACMWGVHYLTGRLLAEVAVYLFF